MPVDCRLHITAAYKKNRTYLKDCFFSQPFKIANITEDRSSDLLRLMMMSSSPGILNNDKYTIDLHVAQQAKLWLTTQGYQRIFTMKDSASQEVSVLVDGGGSFFYLPHPNVPHEGSDFFSENTIDLKRNHQLLWSEIITCGRKLSGEAFRFRKYRNVTNIYIEGKLVVKENVFLEPLKQNIQAIGQLESHTHQSSLLFLDNRADMQMIAEECRLVLSQQDVTFGISELAANGLVIRMLGFKAEQLYNLHIQLTTMMYRLSGRETSPVETVKTISTLAST